MLVLLICVLHQDHCKGLLLRVCVVVQNKAASEVRGRD